MLKSGAARYCVLLLSYYVTTCSSLSQPLSYAG
ncbi:hypothetical protein CYQXPUPM_0003 [Klebsiella phage Saitama]|uniref:Uncharacterized protein n=1 Tax=Klebsiella phage Saitama TaxID=3018528 RepID=A0AAF0D7H7_9CAUD|nr:hypothetical protein CYQXPUPM_0003 [Klebsiella phage Saitama]